MSISDYDSLRPMTPDDPTGAALNRAYDDPSDPGMALNVSLAVYLGWRVEKRLVPDSDEPKWVLLHPNGATFRYNDYIPRSDDEAGARFLWEHLPKWSTDVGLALEVCLDVLPKIAETRSARAVKIGTVSVQWTTDRGLGMDNIPYTSGNMTSLARALARLALRALS